MRRVDIFLSHAGEDQRALPAKTHLKAASLIPPARLFFTPAPNTLMSGQQVKDPMLQALGEAAIVVFFLSKDFVTKAWPMKELIESIKRHDAAPGDIALVPIFSPMSLVEVKKIKELYSKDDFWIGKEKPEPSVLLKWEEAFQTLCKFQGFQPSRFQGLVSELVQGTFVPLLIKHGRLAEDFTVRAGQKKFIGRDAELETVMEALQRVRRILIWGGPGEGKSALAAEAGEALGYVKYPGGMFQVDMANAPEGDPLRDYISKDLKLGLELEGHSVAGDTWEDVLRHLRRSYPILILFDNCERIHKRVREFQGALDELYALQSVSYIIASRLSDFPLEDTFPALEVKPVPDKDARHIVFNTLGEGFPFLKGELDALITVCANNAFLLGVVSGFLNTRKFTVQAVIALGARVTVDGTFNPLYLVEKKVKIFLDALLSELEKEALVKLAVFGGSFSSTGMEYVNEGSVPSASVMILERPQVERYSMHLLVKEYLTDIGAKGETATKARARFVEWTFDCSEGPGAELQLCDPSTGSKRLSQALSILLWDMSNFMQAVRYVSEVEDLHVKVLRDEHLATLTSMNNLAETLRALGRLTEAERIHKTVLDHRMKVLGDEHPDTLKSMGNLATLSSAMGLHSEAEKLGKKVLILFKKVLGEKDPATLTAMANLANVWATMGRHLEAEKLGRMALDLYMNEFGNNDMSTFKVKNNLAESLRALGRYFEAEELQREVLDFWMRGSGKENPHTLTAMGNLAETLWAMGQYPEAEDLQREVMDFRKKVLGAQHPDTLTSINNLGSTLRSMGRLSDAEQLHREVFDLRVKVLGDEHPDTLTSMGDLSDTLQAAGSYLEAEKLGKEVLDINKKVFGDEHPTTLTAMANLATLFAARGLHLDAEQLGRKALDLYIQVFGNEHPDTLMVKNNFVMTLKALGRHWEAEKLQTEVLQLHKKVLGDEHLDTLTAMGNQAETLTATGRYSEAETLQKEVLQLRKKVLGDEHPQTLASMANLASTLSATERYTEAEKLQTEV